LKRVIVSYESTIAMEPTLDEALRKVFAGAKGRITTEIFDDEGVAMVAPERTWQSLAGEATQLFNSAVSAQKDGEWSVYGEQLEALESTLKDLMQVARP
jgi:uncharacterized membrane protein (UPF0182 family)